MEADIIETLSPQGVNRCREEIEQLPVEHYRELESSFRKMLKELGN